MKKLLTVFVVLILVAGQSVIAQKTSNEDSNCACCFFAENAALFDNIAIQIDPQLKAISDSIGVAWKGELKTLLQNREGNGHDWEVKSGKVSVMYEVTSTYAKLWIDYGNKSLFIMSSSQEDGWMMLCARNTFGKSIDIEDTEKISKWVRNLPS